MTTCGDLIDRAVAQLNGWGATSDRITALSASMAADDSTFTVSTVSGAGMGISPGIVEIDGEQMYVATVNSANGSCTVAPGFGRGYAGTTAAAHASGTKVTSQPRWPRSWLLGVLNDVLASTWPQLYVVTTTDTTVPTSGEITLTAGFIVDVRWQNLHDDWVPVRGYRLSDDGTLRLVTPPPTGRPLTIVHAGRPTAFAGESDNFTVCGLPDTAADLLALGTVARCAVGPDVSRTQLSSVEQSDRNKVVPSSAGVSAAKYLMAEYQLRIQQEATALRRRYRPRIVKVGA